MKVVLQRVNSASVTVNNKIVGQINKGILVYLGISNNWNQEKFDWLAKKIINLRIWASDKKGFDLSLKDINGEILLVSQFTLHGKINGNKPDFRDSLKFNEAQKVYNNFITKLKESGLKVETGEFGAMMQIDSQNDGPVTLIIER